MIHSAPSRILRVIAAQLNNQIGPLAQLENRSGVATSRKISLTLPTSTWGDNRARSLRSGLNAHLTGFHRCTDVSERPKYLYKYFTLIVLGASTGGGEKSTHLCQRGPLSDCPAQQFKNVNLHTSHTSRQNTVLPSPHVAQSRPDIACSHTYAPA